MTGHAQKHYQPVSPYWRSMHWYTPPTTRKLVSYIWRFRMSWSGRAQECIGSGMHALELAKTAWNATVTDSKFLAPSALEEAAKAYLRIAARVMNIYGEEGDEGGPLAEINILRQMLQMP